MHSRNAPTDQVRGLKVHGVALERQLDRLAGQGLGLAGEQDRGGDRRLVAAADPAAEGICPTGPC